jgi:transglutaminase-like putative cysteine protease
MLAIYPFLLLDIINPYFLVYDKIRNKGYYYLFLYKSMAVVNMVLKQRNRTVIYLGIIVLGLSISIADAAPIGSNTYIIKTSYIVNGGSGQLPLEVFSHNLHLVPSLPGFQERVSAKLYVNSREVNFSIGIDEEGNEYPFVSLSYAGRLNITLVQRVVVYPASARGFFKTADNLPWPLRPEDELPRNGFWRCNGTKINLPYLENVSKTLSMQSASPIEYAEKIVSWLKNRGVKYENSFGGVVCPSRFLEQASGACGDYASFIAALFKIKGVKSYVFYALVYDAKALVTSNSTNYSFVTRGAYPHMFTVIDIDGKRVPIDATANTGDPIKGASVVALDNVVILYKVMNRDPNDYLILYAPNNDAKVSLIVEITQANTSTPMLDTEILLGLLAIALVLISKRWDTVEED